jgi:type I restriction enzyme M protein
MCVIRRMDAVLEPTKQKVLDTKRMLDKARIRREVLPYTPDAWIKEDATKVGYEVSFTRHFYKPQPLRTLEEISAEILAVEKEAEGLLDGLLKVGRR